MTDATDDIDYGYDGEEEIELTEEDQNLLARYKKYKDKKVVMIRDKESEQMFVAFTLKEIMRLSKLIENEI